MLAITVVAGAVAGYTVHRRTPTYQATATILVTPVPEGDPTFLGLGVVLDTGDPARTVQTAASLIDSQQAAAATAAALGHGWTAAGVQSATSVTPLGQSNVLAVTGSASTSAGAAQLANTFATQAVAYRAAIVQRNISNEIAVLQSRIASLPASQPGQSAEVTDLSTRLGELRAAHSTGGDPTLSVSERAQPPGSPSGASKIIIILLAVLGGFAVASVVALGLEFFGRPVRDLDELAMIFPAPILASVPRVRHPRNAPLSPWQLPPSAFEQIRMLRVQLELASTSPVIMVTSAGAGDGKTSVAGALAAALSEGGRSVILMDLDFRKPSVARVLDLPTGPEQPDANPSGALLSSPRLPGVKFLPLPPVSPSTLDDLIARLPVLLAQAQRVVDYIVLDTAPVSEVSETLRIAPMCESVVFVARPRHTDRGKLNRARELLARANINVAGVVLVGSVASGGYGYYGYGYGHPGPQGNGMRAETPGSNQAAPAAELESRDA